MSLACKEHGSSRSNAICSWHCLSCTVHVNVELITVLGNAVVPASKVVRVSPLLHSVKSDVKLEAEVQDTWHLWDPAHLGILDGGCPMWWVLAPEEETTQPHACSPCHTVPLVLCVECSWCMPTASFLSFCSALRDHSSESPALSLYGFIVSKELMFEVVFQMYLLVFVQGAEY